LKKILWNKRICCAIKMKVQLLITYLIPNDLIKCIFTILFVISIINYHLPISTHSTNFINFIEYLLNFIIPFSLNLFTQRNLQNYIDYHFRIFFNFTKSLFSIKHFHFLYYLYFNQVIIHFLNYLILVFITLIISYLFLNFQPLLNYNTLIY